ncbi:PepSY-associated TM helix domain-containing protein [Caballeronia sordidicola]|uniref:Putative iron-regulated membrane protein, Iron-uptake factor PiuB n=1 Tax=Caballeronia sordidicola TaxID=196367 RepID=A0A242MW70_CABSO|nr:PepSY domain-containing protein [Caballeronia sordidicola]OTP75690.1 putative iron-regulated membrane protein, Iron-uptake factor PiuB [Caballeronia sordidicola]
MTRRILFQVHWLLGVTVGLVLALMGLTGATMSFEDEITGLLNSSTISVAKGAELMSPDALLASIRAQLPGEEIRPLVLSADPERAAQFRVRQPSGAATFYANPYSGLVLGKAAGSDFFSLVEDLHRFLALPITEGGATARSASRSPALLRFRSSSSRCPDCTSDGRASRSTGARGSCST